MRDEEIVEVLRKENEEFRRLAQEHRSLDNQIGELNRKPYLTTDEEMEKKRVQKEKLLRKDRMAEIIRMYKKNIRQPENT